MTELLEAPFDPEYDHPMEPAISMTERHLIGMALIQPRVLDEVRLRPDDFYRPDMEAAWRLMLKMAASGRPVSMMTLADEAKGAGIRGLEHSALSAAMTEGAYPHLAGQYADMVRTASRRRQVMAVGQRLMQDAESAPEPEGLIEAAVATLDKAMTDSGPADLVRLPDAASEFLEGLDREIQQVRSPWRELDKWIGGWRPGRMYVIGARPGAGKALDLATPIPTPTGWTTMGDVSPGDYVMGMDGRPTLVVAATEVMIDRPCFKIGFSDGSTVIADAEHEWLTDTRSSRRAATPPGGYTFNRSSPLSRDQRHLSEVAGVKTTREIAATLTVGSDARVNHSVDVAGALDLPAADLPIDPYVLGYWLGDGSSAHAVITVHNDDHAALIGKVEAAGYYHRSKQYKPTCLTVTVSTQPIVRGGALGRDSLSGRLRAADLINDKRIPAQYLRASADQRRALLAGLLDSDGAASKSGQVVFAVCSKPLADGFTELARSLGHQTHTSTKRVKGRSEATSICYSVSFSTSEQVFTLGRKAARIAGARRSSSGRRYITSAVPVASVPVRCIQVAADDHLYLAGEAMIPTHNSIVGLQAAQHMATVTGRDVALSSLEMDRGEVSQRALCAATSVDFFALQNRHVSREQKIKLWEAQEAMDDAKGAVLVDDRSSVRPGDVAAHARKVARGGNLGMVVVDYLQLMEASGGGRSESRQQDVSVMTRAMKNLARDLQVPVLVLSQLNRAVESRGDGPRLSDLRESGSLEQDADVVLLLHHETQTEQTAAEPDGIEMRVAKNRQGPQGVANLLWEGKYMRVTD